MATQHQLTLANEGITCHAWSPDLSMVAFCPNNNEIHIFGKCNTPSWEKLHVLTEHDMLVSSIDWCPVHNKIVSCSHDRNAFVWTYDPVSSIWKPALVVLRIDRAALHVRWSVDGTRFAVASGSKCVPVCSYDSKHDWWVSKIIKKKFKSSVTCVAFHPTNSQLLATGSTDFKCRVYSTHHADIDGTEAFLEFGEPVVEYTSAGWITSVAWSPSGQVLSFTAHDSSISFIDMESDDPVPQTLRLSFLPMNDLIFLSETVVIAAGHDFIPMLLGRVAETGWCLISDETGIDPGSSNVATKQSRGSPQRASSLKSASNDSGVAAARSMFQSKSMRGQEFVETALSTQHENAITCLQIMSRETHPRFSSSSLDGRLVVWDLDALLNPGGEFSELSLAL